MAKLGSLIFLPLLLSASTTAVARAEPPTEPAAPKRMPAMRKAGWYTLGAGGALVLTSAVFWGMAASDQTEFNRTRGHEAADAYALHIKETKLFGYVGLAAVVTGVTLVLVSPSENDVRVSASLGQLSLSGKF